MSFTLPPLPYDLGSLEPHMSKQVLELHYGVHTKKYYETAAQLAKGTPFEDKPLEDLLTKNTLIKMDSTLFNNVSQAWNHTFFWNCLTPDNDQRQMSAELKDRITVQYETLDNFKKQFTDAATKVFGSGWAWLVVKQGRLSIITTPNGGSPLTQDNVIPLLTCDMWEHAYYIQHHADRAAYLKNFWQIVNWKFVSEQYAATRNKFDSGNK